MTLKETTACVFVDTNVYLHFQLYDQINWPETLGYKRVCLLVPPIVASDLDKFKNDNQSRRRRDRSRSVLKSFSEIIQKELNTNNQLEVRDSVYIEFIAHSADVSHFPGLHPENGDDQLIASILDYKANRVNTAEDTVILVTDDFGLTVKCKAHDIISFLMPERLRLPDEPTVDEQKVAKLTHDLDVLLHREPKLRIAFIQNNDEYQELRLALDIIADLDLQDIDRLSHIEENKIEWKQYSKSKIDNSSGIPIKASELSIAMQIGKMWDPFANISEQEIKRYREETLTYINDYKPYLIEYHKWMQWCGRKRKITFGILNEGTSPALGVIVRIVVSDGLIIVDPDDPRKEPEKPDRPKKPRTSLDLMAPYNISASLFSPNRFIQNYPQMIGVNENEPAFDFCSSTMVEWSQNKILHNRQLIISLDLMFPILANHHSYEITYTLFAENLIKPINGTLTICAAPSGGVS